MAQYKCELLVEGMHCAACELFVESNLKKHSSVKSAKVDRGNAKVELTLNSHEDSKLIKELNKLIAKGGYKLTHTKAQSRFNTKEWGIAAIISATLVLAYLGLQNSSLLQVSDQNIFTPLIVGLVASVSTCMAVVGGIVLSLAASQAWQVEKTKKLLTFHASRLISFFILGGLIGFLGQAFSLSILSTIIINLVLFIVMLMLGLSMTGLISAEIHLPKIFGQSLLERFGNRSDYFGAIILGAITFVLPCGFTQSMQVYSLTTGSPLSGAMTMLLFAIGTLPVLALISFGSINLAKWKYKSIFYKTAGLLIIGFAMINLISVLNLIS